MSTQSPETCLLSRLFACDSDKAAIEIIKKLKKQERSALAALAGLEATWCDCDQTIRGNVVDLATEITTELYSPYRFLKSSLTSAEAKLLFSQGKATRPLSFKRGYWEAPSNSQVQQKWLPDASEIFDSVVHFVQFGSGTGISVGNGLILTCAHVVSTGDDDDEDSESPPPLRIGRKKVVMFASGRTFVAECIAVEENADGTKDVAVLLLKAEVDLTTGSGNGPPRRGTKRSHSSSASTNEDFIRQCRVRVPAVSVSHEAVGPSDRLFCIGNPSKIDLERSGSIEFSPPTWHMSVGAVEGSGGSEGRGGFLQHSCWTYWGHSGAPLFDSLGRLVSLHCAWDPNSGIRQGQHLEHLLAALKSVGHSSSDVPGEGCSLDCAAAAGANEAALAPLGPILVVGSSDGESDDDILPLAKRLAKRRGGT